MTEVTSKKLAAIAAKGLKDPMNWPWLKKLYCKLVGHNFEEGWAFISSPWDKHAFWSCKRCGEKEWDTAPDKKRKGKG